MITPTHMFTETATYTQNSASIDANGFVVIGDVGPTPPSSFACSLQPRDSSESIEMGRDTGHKAAVIYFGPGVTLGLTDAITVAGETYRVTGPTRDVASKGVLFVANVEREV